MNSRAWIAAIMLMGLPVITAEVSVAGNEHHPRV
jgi:hypothetical protein